jgi:hypothetical protein
MRAAAVLVTAAAVLARAPLAHACTCPLPSAVYLPGDGSTDLPLNTGVAILDGDGLQIELHDAADAVVPITVEMHEDWRVLRPMAPLAPDAMYTVVDVTTATPVTRVTFTTGEAMDTEPPAFGGLVQLAPTTYPVDSNLDAPCTSSCVIASGGVASQLELMFVNPPPDTAVFVATVYRQRDHHVLSTTRITPDTHFLGFQECGPQAPALEVGAMYCASLAAYDLAGNVAGDNVEVCSGATPSCTLGASCALPAWRCSRSAGGDARAASDRRRLQAERAEEVGLPERHAVVAQDRVRVREVEEEVRQRVLDEEVGAGHRLALPARPRDRARARVREVRAREPLEVAAHVGHARAQLVDGGLGVGVRGRGLARELRCRQLRRVTGDLHLPHERELVGREPRVQERVRLERLALRERDRRVEPLLELPEQLAHFTVDLEVHPRSVALAAIARCRSRAARDPSSRAR